MEDYSAEQASRLTGADYHNILYWLRSGLVHATHSPNRQPKPRHPVRFSSCDLLEISIVQELRKYGIPVQRIRKALDVLRTLSITHTRLLDPCAPLSDAMQQHACYLDVSSDDIHLYAGKHDVLSVVQHHGQKVIHLLIVDIVRLREELRSKLLGMHNAVLAHAE